MPPPWPLVAGVAGRGGIKPIFVSKVMKKWFYAPWRRRTWGHKTSFCAQSEEKVVLCPPLGAGGGRRRAGGGIKPAFVSKVMKKLFYAPLASQGASAQAGA